jgi:hypothetical protein
MGGPGSGRRKGSHGKQTDVTKARLSAGRKGKKGTPEYGKAFRENLNISKIKSNLKRDYAKTGKKETWIYHGKRYSV